MSNVPLPVPLAALKADPGAPAPGRMKQTQRAAAGPGAGPAVDARIKELESQLELERGLRTSYQKRVAHLEQMLRDEGVEIVSQVAKIPGSTSAMGERKKGKRKKDPERPKRATTAYLAFCERHRKEVMEAHPSVKSKEITSILASMWGSVSDKEKEACEEIAALDRKRLESEMVEYNNKRKKEGAPSA